MTKFLFLALAMAFGFTINAFAGPEKIASCGPAADFMSMTKEAPNGSQTTIYFLRSSDGDIYKVKTLYNLSLGTAAFPNAKCATRSFRSEPLNSNGDYMVVTQTCGYLSSANQKFEKEYIFSIYSSEKPAPKKGYCTKNE